MVLRNKFYQKRVICTIDQCASCFLHVTDIEFGHFVGRKIFVMIQVLRKNI